MFRTVCSALALSLALTLPAQADDITDALDSARQAYADGDVKYALEELDYARQLLSALNTEALTGFLPQAPDGWTRTVNTEINASLGMMGGGTGAEAEYSGPGDSFTVTIMADNPMVGAMAGVLANAAMMGLKVERVGREKFAFQDGEFTGLIDSRILVKASGGDRDMMLDALKTMDFRGLKDFGR